MRPAGPAGVILAGGASSRMGTDKALVEIGGVPMVERVGAALEQVATGGVYVQGRSGTLAGYRCVPDDTPGRRGPLSGLATALRQLPAEAPLVAVGVDHPFVRADTLRGLVDRFDPVAAVVPIASGVRQVTVAVYGAGLDDLARRTLEAGGSLQDMLDGGSFIAVKEHEWRSWGEDGRSWFSVDSPADIDEGLARFGSGFGA